MNCYRQVAQGVDVTPLALDLQRQPHLWDKNPCRLSKRGPHHETQDIFLRYRDETSFIESGDWSGFASEHTPEWCKSIDLLPGAKTVAFDLMTRFKGEMLGGIFLYRVQPGKKIHPHVDKGWHADYFDKFNVCLQSNPRAAFVYPKDGEALVQKMGDVHWFRNDVMHEVVNEGEDDHIVLTVCLRMDRGVRAPWSPEGWTMDGSREV